MFMGIAMFLHNKFLSFLIACTVANPCFAGVNIGMRDISSGISYTNPENFNRPVLVLSNGNYECPKNYYIAKCGDMDLDLKTILSYVKTYHHIEANCWDYNDFYTDMHYLLHLTNNGKYNYVGDNNIFFTTSLLWANAANCGDLSDNQLDCELGEENANDEIVKSQKQKLQEIRETIYNKCINSTPTCLPCPNGGQTDGKSETVISTPVQITCEIKDDEGIITTPAEYKVYTFWKSFNTIADCYTYGGSDGKGTFETVRSNPETEANRCYYSYYSE